MSETTGGPLADPKDKLILIVDDDESILDLLEHIVKKEGFRVERAVDGPEAVRKVEAVNPNLIILDFMLPGMGGFEVLKELQMGELRAIPVIVITGRKIDRHTVEILLQEANVKQFIEKPIKPVVLVGSLHKLLATRAPDVRRAIDRGPLSSGGW
ncbi:MAG TPA: response regulator [Elusimicrobiota bacterium]|nr:response regulator [Elusimicrobiota bacterium]